MEYKGYCVRCKNSKTMKNPEVVDMKGNRRAAKGKCPDCSTTMFRILGKEK